MYSTDNFTWETASIQRVSAEIDTGTQTNSLKYKKSEFWMFRLPNRPRLDLCRVLFQTTFVLTLFSIKRILLEKIIKNLFWG